MLAHSLKSASALSDMDTTTDHFTPLALRVRGNNNNKERREGGNTYRTILLSHTGRVQLLNRSLATETSYITLSLTSFRTFVSAISMAKLGGGHPHY